MAAKEHETYIICWVPSQSKSIAKYLPYKESIILLFEVIYGLSMTTNNKGNKGGGFPGIIMYTKLTADFRRY